MKVLGICVDPNGGNPRLRCVVASGTFANPTLIDEFDITTSETEPARQAVSLAKLLQGRLPGISADKAAVRKASPAPKANRRQASFSRAHCEGAVLYVLNESLDGPVTLGDPQTLATAQQVSKEQLNLAGDSLTHKRKEAAVAALSGLDL